MKYIIVDTNILIDNLNELLELENVTLIIPTVVFDELDTLKNRDYHVARKARVAIRELIEIIGTKNILSGIKYGKNNLILRAIENEKSEKMNDDKILDVLIDINDQHPHAYLCTNDLSLRLKAIGLGFKIYTLEDTSTEIDAIAQVYIPGGNIDDLYNNERIKNNFGDFSPNSYVNFRDSHGTSQSALTRYDTSTNEFVLIKRNRAFGISPKNSEQSCALDALLNDDIPVVILTGPSGVGKTILTLAAALEKTIEKQVYGRVLLTRPNVPIGNDLGFLPGTKDEKLFNWFGGYRDNIQQLTGTESKFDIFVDSGIIELEALTYFRGRSLYDCFVICDEMQNCGTEQLKTILTRIGVNSKLVLMGDPTQIDNSLLTTDTNGLTTLIKKKGDTNLISHIHLTDSKIRSQLTAWAVQNL